MRRVLPYFIAVIISIVISFGVTWMFLQSQKPKTGYVKLARVHENFELSKKLDAEFKATVTARKNYIDSLEFRVKALYAKASGSKDKQLQEDFESAQRHFMYQKEQFEDAAGAMEQQYSEQIWKQLNDYIKQYGKENNYSYIFGADGSGTLMYAGDAEDLTEQVLQYVNDKYQGK